VNTVVEPVSFWSGERLRPLIARARESGLAGTQFLESIEGASGLDPEEFMAELGALTRFRVLRMGPMHELAPAFDVLPYTECAERACMLLREASGELLLAFADPFDAAVRAWAEERISQPYALRIVHRADLTAYLAQQEETLRAMDALAAGDGRPEGAAGIVDDLSLRTISEHTSPVVRLLDSTLYDALKAGASDIHLETAAGGLLIKYRIDGVLVSMGSAGGTELAEQVISRVKVMSELDIAERRVPQDGRFRVGTGGREVDFRVSVMPSLLGEDAVLRILDQRTLAGDAGLRLESLGFDAPVLKVIRRLAGEPYGMVLVTGPTGSGKTTTLYAAVSEINDGRDKIITIEDPVEYQLPGVLQIPVNEKKGLTFARGLRSILRHDPDRIMVGEIRDPETAQIAVQAALTGHLVYTTVHANNVFDVIGRFMHMGVEPYSFVSALNGVVAQRLVRLLCRHCAEPVAADGNFAEASGLAPALLEGATLRSAPGCGQCRGSGYRGRKAIAEYLLLTDEVRELIVAREPIRRIKEAVRGQGTQLLREAAMAAVLRGETDLKEINRVTVAA
jgi:general secretion pathway protein E